jgi:hypothetical protein
VRIVGVGSLPDEWVRLRVRLRSLEPTMQRPDVNWTADGAFALESLRFFDRGGIHEATGRGEVAGHPTLHEARQAHERWRRQDEAASMRFVFPTPFGPMTTVSGLNRSTCAALNPLKF